MNSVVLKLASLEYFRSWTGRAPGGRDFLWMTMLMFFVQLLALVIITAREGVLERSVDAFLGNKPGYGIPIWTLPNILGENQPVMITNELLGEMQDSGYPVAPFRRIYNDQMIRMPGKGIWASGSLVREIQFSGMAADLKGPLAPQLQLASTGPVDGNTKNWTIVLDEPLFRQFFDLSKYREALKGQLPESELAKIPTDSANLTDLSVIWLNVKVHRSERLTPFNVRWSKYFGIGASQSAYLVPIEMLNLFNAARNNQHFCSFLEAGPELGRRIRSLKSPRLLGKSPDAKEEIATQFKALAEVMQGEFIDRATRYYVFFGNAKAEAKTKRRGICDGGVSEQQLKMLANAAGLQVTEDMIDETLEPTQKLKGTLDGVDVACSAIEKTRLEKLTTVGTGENCIAKIPAATKSTGYSEMLLFAQSRLEIKSLVDFMSCREAKPEASLANYKNLCVATNEDSNDVESRLMINQIYEDSLTRFSFLTELLNAISGPIGVVMILMLAAILWVQLGTLLGHRRVRYAMLLSNGLTWVQLRAMIVAQVTIGVILSLAAGVLVMLLIRAVLFWDTDRISQLYEKITLGRAIDVLPLSISAVATVGIATLITAIVLTWIQLWLNNISHKQPLDQLLH